MELVDCPEARQAFGTLQDNLLVKWHETDTRRIVVCAAAPGEGASTVALGLAMATARNQQERILLVDGNLHRPCLGGLWPGEKPGLADFLAGRTTLEAVPQPTSIPNLWVMTVGQDFANYTQHLMATPIRQAFALLSEQFSRLILDGPAVNNYPESPLYAHYADSILLVVAAGRSRAPVVQHALAKFPLNLRERIEVVLNRRIYPIPKVLYEKLWSY